MDSKWRVLDFTAYEGFLSYERGRIVAGERSTPLAEVDFILLGMGCSWGYGLVAGLERFDVAAAICDWRNQPISTLYHWSENTKVFTRHEAQAELSVPRGKNAWMQIVKAKLRGQANCLDAMGRQGLRIFVRWLVRCVLVTRQMLRLRGRACIGVRSSRSRGSAVSSCLMTW